MSRWIPVLVRLEDLQAVTRFIGELESSRTTAADEDGDVIELVDARDAREAAGVQVPARPPWALKDLQRLARGETVTTARWALAMDVCASSPQTWFGTSKIAELSGMTVAQWRDACRKLTPHLRNAYPDVPRKDDGGPYWPLAGRSVPEYPGEVSWAITADMARLWQQVRS